MVSPASFLVNLWGAISPDGTMVAMDLRDPVTRLSDVWLRDLIRGTDSRFTFGRFNSSPVWSPDGSHIAFSSTRDGVAHVYQKDTSGGQDQVLTQALEDPPRPTYPIDWSRDGQYIIEEVRGGGAITDLWVQPFFGDKKPFPYLKTQFTNRQAKLSPDGKWLAYASSETSRFEVYVQTFPTPGSKAQISTAGGSKPVWRRDGKELYFISADRKMMAVDVKTGAKFQAGTPKSLFDSRIGGDALNLFDVSKDGRFLIPQQPEQSASSPLTVVLNWPALLKK
jgi:Tol biopolymer transport system component